MLCGKHKKQVNGKVQWAQGGLTSRRWEQISLSLQEGWTQGGRYGSGGTGACTKGDDVFGIVAGEMVDEKIQSVPEFFQLSLFELHLKKNCHQEVEKRWILRMFQFMRCQKAIFEMLSYCFEKCQCSHSLTKGRWVNTYWENHS